jgi:spermidine synthase
VNQAPPLSRTRRSLLQVVSVLILTGFTATVGQIVLLRELMVVAYGNEISLGVMLASWLLWTALGSAVMGRLPGGIASPSRVLAALQTLSAILLPTTIFAIRASRAIFRVYPGELLGPLAIFLICLLTLSCFCLVSGAAFVAGSRFHASERSSSVAAALNSMYLFEASGSALAGLLAGLVFLPFLSSLQTILLVATLNLMAVALLLLRRQSLRLAIVGILTAAYVFAWPPLGHRLETASVARLWPGFRALDTRNSVYGNLAVVETNGVRSLLENGLVMFHAPDPATAEEAVHFALLEHPAPKSLLLIGGGAGGSLQQALGHSTLERVDYVELDPMVFDLAEKYFPAQWSAARADPRVHLHHEDGRLFLKTTRQLFDVIIVNLPAPQTAQLNRFYTLEFFREASAKLADGGVFSFQLPAAEEYLSPDLSAFLRCISKTLHQAFPVVHTIPGETVHFSAAKKEGVLAASASDLLTRLRDRHLKTSYVREYFIAFRMAPDRIADLEQNVEPRADTPINRDLAPVAYYFDVELWSTQFNREYQRVFESIERLSFERLATVAALLLLVAAALIGRFALPANQARWSAAFCIALAGLTGMSLEVLLLLGFQAVYGYVYHQLAILIALFMAGMAVGSWLRLRIKKDSAEVVTSRVALKLLAALQVLAAASPLLIFWCLAALAAVKSLAVLTLASHLAFPSAALLAGTLGGYEFALATEVYFRDIRSAQKSTGLLYGLDLLGACLGALLLSAFLLPLFGFFNAAVFIAAVNLAPAVLAASLGWATPESRPS